MANLQTVQKIGPVLDLFTIERPEWGVSEVASAINAPRSSAHGLLASLADIGLLQCRVRGRYRIGWRVVELGQTLQGTVSVRSYAAPVIDRLAEKHGETTHLAVMERSRVLYVDKVVGNHNITVRGARVGTRLEPHCTAVGKVLMSPLDEAEIRRCFATRPPRRLTAATITDPAVLIETLRGVRSAGCAYDLGEAVTDVHCVAAPVRDQMGSVVAAMSITAPAGRFEANRAEYARSVVAAAHEVSRAMAAASDSVVPLPIYDPTRGAVPAGTAAPHDQRARRRAL